MAVLKKAFANNEIPNGISKYHHMDVEAVLKTLEAEIDNSYEKFDFLRNEQPALYIFLLERRGSY